MSLDLCFKQLHVVHIKGFQRMQYMRLLLFKSVIFQSVIFQSCKFHPLFLDGPSFSTPANSSHPSRSRSRTLWSRSWPWSHYELVSLTSLVGLCLRRHESRPVDRRKGIRKFRTVSNFCKVRTNYFLSGTRKQIADV